MEVLHERCCGLDIHKKSITACIITPKGKEIKTFGTKTRELEAMVNWIVSKGCTHVAMESTGVYWKPIYNLLELEDVEILVVNAHHIKAVPGRKTDIKDAEWIADLLRHGLLTGSYIPDREQRELRELIRYRRSLVDERSREVNRIQKLLEGCNIKLSSVATDITGVSGRNNLSLIANGVDDPEFLSQLAKGRLRNKEQELKEALHGLVGNHQRMMLSMMLERLDSINEDISSLDREIERRMRPFDQELELLDTIPGVGLRIAQEIIAEAGVDMERFPTAQHFASWAGVAPGSNESAGKRKSGKVKRGNKNLYYTLTRAATSAARTKDTYLSDKYRRIAARRGSRRAAVAVAHKILVAVYHMLKNKQPYQELGANYLAQRKKATVVNHAIKQLESLGYKVNIEAVA